MLFCADAKTTAFTGDWYLTEILQYLYFCNIFLTKSVLEYTGLPVHVYVTNTCSNTKECTNMVTSVSLMSSVLLESDIN